VGDCLKKLDSSSLSKECLDFIKFHDSCKSEITSNCAGKEYTSDAILCLTEWTKGVEYSAECQETLPKPAERKQPRESDKLGTDAKRKADMRRKYKNLYF